MLGQGRTMSVDHRRRVKQLYWRAGMGLTPSELLEREGRRIDDLLDDLFRSAADPDPITVVHPPSPQDRYDAMVKREQDALLRENQRATGALNLAWLRRLAMTEGCLREKMAFFWHGHLACWSPWSVNGEQYLNTLREHALGNFGELLKAVSRTPAMLRYLGNHRSRKDAPNENFAREVMELFTLGRGHYSEQDIHEAARAFTGWTFDLGTSLFEFREDWHDDGSKTFRGRTGNWDGDDILDMILEDRRCAEFICDKLYRWFVNPEPDAVFVAAMSTRFHESHYDISDLMRFVFESDHFYEERNIGARVRSPIELLCGLEKLFAPTFARDDMPLFIQRSFDQILLQPPSVAGWTQGTGWIDANSLMLRLKLPSVLLGQGGLDWRDPAASAGEMDQMVPGAPEGGAPLLDERGRRVGATADRQRFLSQLPEPLDNEGLCDLLLPVAPSAALLSSLSGADTWQRTVQIVSSPEYQLC